MFAIKADVSSEVFNARGLKTATRESMRLALIEHKIERLPERFAGGSGTQPGGKFRFKRRSAKYNRRKQQLFGHTIPLVFSGELRDKVLSSARITATSSRADLKASGSRKSRLSDEMRREIEFIPLSEEVEFRKTMEETISFLPKDKRLKRSRKSRV